MDIYEITGYQTGIARDGVNYLEPADSFTDIRNGYVRRQILQSRKGVSLFAPQLADASKVSGIFEHILPDGTKELLVTDANNMYKYNTGTGTFDPITLGGSMVGYTGFNLSNSSYISGTSYSDKDNNGRFIFTSSGITINTLGAVNSGVFYYDNASNTILDFINDAPDYQQPASDIGDIRRAKHVMLFGERLNFINPQTSVTTYNQGILFSGIRNADGNGDKFNVAGAGLIQLDTYNDIKGAQIFGDLIALNLTRSNWVLQKTTDAFNPYKPRKIPSVIGSDSSFGFAQWNDLAVSIGRTGILSMNERQSLRIDNKIPYFTRDDMSRGNFDIIYGGFDRDTSQFLFAYLSSDEDENLTNPDKILAYDYEFKSWSTSDFRACVFGQTDIGQELTWSDIDENIKPSWERWDTTEEVWNKIGVTSSVQKTLIGDDQGFIFQWNQDNDDYHTSISDITKATNAVVSIDDRPFRSGDFVVIENVEGMTEINNYNSETDEIIKPVYRVTSNTSTTVTLDIDSTNYSTYTQGGTISKVIPFSAKTNPFNPYRGNGMKCYISMVEFLINSDSRLYVSVYADGETDPIKENILLEPYNKQKQRNWLGLTVDHEADFFTFEMNLVTAAKSVEITSVRIHAMQGGLTNG